MFGNYHPIIIHFPVALLTVAPLFFLLSIIIKSHSKTFLLSTIILVFLGTAGLFLAVESGESAAEMIAKNTLSSGALSDLNEHAEHAEQTRNLYAGLTIVLILLFFAQNKLPPKILYSIPIILLLCSIGLTAILLKTAHYGGKLVHEHHIHSQLFDQPQLIQK